MQERTSGVPSISIDSLNDDLLVNIFMADPLEFQVFRLSLVCKRWSRIIASDSRLWRDIHPAFVPYQSSTVTSFIRWAQPRAGLIKSCHYYLGHYPTGCVAVLDQLTALTSLTLVLKDPPGLHILDIFLCLLVKMPDLHYFEMWHSENSEYEYELDISALQYVPSLRTLKLDHSLYIQAGEAVGAEAIAACAPNLTCLQCEPCDWENHFFLSRLRELRSLSLDGHATGDADTSEDISCMLNALLHLTSLCLRYRYTGSDLTLRMHHHTDLACLTLCAMLDLRLFPRPFVELHSLTELSLENMPWMYGGTLSLNDFLAPLGWLPPSSVLPGLKSLSLDCVHVPAFPSVLTNIQGLTYLYCLPQFRQSGPPNQYFTCLPDYITNLRQLKHLRLVEFQSFVLDFDVVLGLRALTCLEMCDCSDLRILYRVNAGRLEAVRALRSLSRRIKLNFEGTNIRM